MLPLELNRRAGERITIGLLQILLASAVEALFLIGSHSSPPCQLLPRVRVKHIYFANIWAGSVALTKQPVPGRAKGSSNNGRNAGVLPCISFAYVFYAEIYAKDRTQRIHAWGDSSRAKLPDREREFSGACSPRAEHCHLPWNNDRALETLPHFSLLPPPPHLE